MEGISIINKVGGTITGDSASALPIKLVTSNASLKFFCLGFLAGIVLFISLILLSAQQVAVVEVTGQVPEYKEYILK
jgi:cell division septal protein FtsQ